MSLDAHTRWRLCVGCDRDLWELPLGPVTWWPDGAGVIWVFLRGALQMEKEVRCFGLLQAILAKFQITECGEVWPHCESDGAKRAAEGLPLSAARTIWC